MPFGGMALAVLPLLVVLVLYGRIEAVTSQIDSMRDATQAVIRPCQKWVSDRWKKRFGGE